MAPGRRCDVVKADLGNEQKKYVQRARCCRAAVLHRTNGETTNVSHEVLLHGEVCVVMTHGWLRACAGRMCAIMQSVTMQYVCKHLQGLLESSEEVVAQRARNFYVRKNGDGESMCHGVVRGVRHCWGRVVVAHGCRRPEPMRASLGTFACTFLVEVSRVAPPCVRKS